MRKFLFSIILIVIISTNGLCLAADGDDLNKEQKIAEIFMGVFIKEQVPVYTVVSKDFADILKANVNEQIYQNLKQTIVDKYGNVKEIKFYEFQRFDQGDKITYVAVFDKERAVAIIFTFDKNKKMTNYIFSPLQIEEVEK